VNPFTTLPLKPTWIAIALLAISLLSVVLPSVRKEGELPVYMKAAHRIVQGEQIYRPDDLPAFTYPPFFALPCALLVPFSEISRSLWWFVNLTLFCGVLWLVTSMAWPIAAGQSRKMGPPIWINSLVIGILSARFLISPLEYESHDLIVLSLVLLGGAALTIRKDGWAGVSVGLAAACKATPLLFLPVFVWQRRARAAALLLVALMVATFLPDVLFPSQDGQRWAVSWYQKFVSKVEVGQTATADGAWARWNPFNQSLPGTMNRLFTPMPEGRDWANVMLVQLPETPLKLLILAMEGAVVVCLAWATWPSRLRQVTPEFQSLFWLGQIGAVLCGMLLLSPMTSTQHLCALFVPITFCVTYWNYCRRSWVVSVAVLGLFVFGTLGAQDVVGAYLSDHMQSLGAGTICALIGLFTSGYIMATHQNQPRVTEPAQDAPALETRAAA
jgi:hypothetical protein